VAWDYKFALVEFTTQPADMLKVECQDSGVCSSLALMDMYVDVKEAHYHGSLRLGGNEKSSFKKAVNPDRQWS
jgi:hypothetical protein